MNNLDKQYKELLQDILDNGRQKTDRTGTGTISVFGRQLRHDFRDGFPLLTTKRMAFKAIVIELLWFLRGDTNIKYLVENGCHIWDGDAYKNYEKWNNSEHVKLGLNVDVLSKEEFINKIKTDDKFWKKWGDLGPIYGKQWRRWENEIINYTGTKYNSQTIDQIQQLINDLKQNPDSRRLMVNAWNVGELHQMVLPPCHYGFQVYTRELSFDERALYINRPEMIRDKNFTEHAVSELTQLMDEINTPTRAISLMWNQRSVDTFLGLPFNIASYGLLLMMIVDEVNMVPEELIGNLGDCHLYSNHIEQAKEQLTRTPYKLPTVHIRDGIFCSSINDVILENYESHPTIKAPLSN